MNAKQLIAAALVFSATSVAFAQQTNVDSGKTREQVKAELQQAQADGTAITNGFLGSDKPVVAAGNVSHQQSENVISRGKTRAEVLAELQQAQSNGTAMPTSFVAYDTPASFNTSAATGSALAHK
jgi:predicted RNase H-like HicB family nuclease